MSEAAGIEPPERLPVTAVVAHGETAWAELVAALRAEPDIDLVAEVESGENLLDTVRAKVPDVVLLATDLLGCDVLDACRHISEELPVCRMVMLSIDDPPYAAVAAGAVGAISSSDDRAAVAHIVRHTARGEAFIPSGWAAELLDEYAELHDSGSSDRMRTPRLTATEREVLRRLANGTTAEAVASLHEVPPRLVRLHAGLAVAKMHRAHRDRRELANRD